MGIDYDLPKGILPSREAFDSLTRAEVSISDGYAPGQAPVPRKVTTEEFARRARETRDILTS